jgi:hypothetical protein
LRSYFVHTSIVPPQTGGITQTFHDEIATELEKKQQELNDRLKLLTSDNKDFQVTAFYLLDLAQRAEQLFNESDEGLRQKLLEYVLSNIELKDKKLSYILNDPFRAVVETKKKSLAAHNSNIWCSIVDALQTSAIKATNEYKLKHLVKIFSLSGEL